MSIQHIAVIGAGTMGNGIAQICALAGLDVTMVDVSTAALERGLSTVTASLDRLVQKDKLQGGHKEDALARIRTSTSYQECKGADLVIEAATENLWQPDRILCAGRCRRVTRAEPPITSGLRPPVDGRLPWQADHGEDGQRGYTTSTLLPNSSSN